MNLINIIYALGDFHSGAKRSLDGAEVYAKPGFLLLLNLNNF